MSDDLITAESLHKHFPGVHAVNDVSLHVAPGEIYGLVGPDGAGKTTLVRLLCGALHPDAGAVTLAGFDMLAAPEQGRERLGYLAQRFALYEDLTVQENLRFFAEVRGLPAARWRERSQEILEFVGLAQFQDRRAGQLSGGMKQKLGLAIALINQPQVLLLDEPTTGVDPVTRQDFWRLIIPLLAHGNLAVLVSTPYMDEAMRCTRIGFMREGRDHSRRSAAGAAPAAGRAGARAGRRTTSAPGRTGRRGPRRRDGAAFRPAVPPARRPRPGGRRHRAPACRSRGRRRADRASAGHRAAVGGRFYRAGRTGE